MTVYIPERFSIANSFVATRIDIFIEEHPELLDLIDGFIQKGEKCLFCGNEKNLFVLSSDDNIFIAFVCQCAEGAMVVDFRKKQEEERRLQKGLLVSKLQIGQKEFVFGV